MSTEKVFGEVAARPAIGGGLDGSRNDLECQTLLPNYGHTARTITRIRVNRHQEKS